jgi:hypothetical protein
MPIRLGPPTSDEKFLGEAADSAEINIPLDSARIDIITK